MTAAHPPHRRGSRETSAHDPREQSGRATRDAVVLAGPPFCGRCWRAAHAADATSAAVGFATDSRIALEVCVAWICFRTRKNEERLRSSSGLLPKAAWRETRWASIDRVDGSQPKAHSRPPLRPDSLRPRPGHSLPDHTRDQRAACLGARGLKSALYQLDRLFRRRWIPFTWLGPPRFREKRGRDLLVLEKLFERLSRMRTDEE